MRVLSPRPRLALNAQLLRLDAGYRSAGIARYIFHLLRALPTAAPEFELHAFVGEPRARDALDALDLHLTRWGTTRPFARILWEQLIFPLHLARAHFDLVHALAFVSPVASHTPSVTTVYDLSFVLYPEYFRSLNRLYLKWGTRRTAARARRVIAISESTRRDLVRLLAVPAEKIDVVPPGVEPDFFAAGDVREAARFRALNHLPDHFLLFVGTLEPRKNIPTLIRAFARAKRQCALPHRLAIAGGHGWGEAAIARTLQESGIQQEVLFPGFVLQQDLPSWYRAADAFIYPSQYEGFGMPPLEALASGTPVIASNRSSLPEAVGDAALLVDPHDEEALADAIVRILTDHSLREGFQFRGPQRAHTFTWERAAHATAQVYRRALSKERK